MFLKISFNFFEFINQNSFELFRIRSTQKLLNKGDFLEQKAQRLASESQDAARDRFDFP